MKSWKLDITFRSCIIAVFISVYGCIQTGTLKSLYVASSSSSSSSCKWWRCRRMSETEWWRGTLTTASHLRLLRTRRRTKSDDGRPPLRSASRCFRPKITSTTSGHRRRVTSPRWRHRRDVTWSSRRPWWVTCWRRSLHARARTAATASRRTSCRWTSSPHKCSTDRPPKCSPIFARRSCSEVRRRIRRYYQGVAGIFLRGKIGRMWSITPGFLRDRKKLTHWRFIAYIQPTMWYIRAMGTL